MDRMEEMSRYFFRHFHARIETEGGLSPSQFIVLKTLKAAGTLTVSDLARSLGMTTAGATGLVDRLTRAGLVTRERDRRDRRVVWVHLSEPGAGQYAAACALRRKILSELFSTLSQGEVAQLVGLYEKVFRNIPVPEAGPTCPEPSI
jgi:DNA-binding MarR family transcriptional regulator